MRAPRLFLFFALVAGLAFAGSRVATTAGTLPQTSSDGVSLVSVTTCRGSVRYTDGGTVTGGTLVPYYYDSILGWIEGQVGSQCALSTTAQVDGGARQSQACEWQVSAQYGRAAIVPKGLTPQAVGIVRLECWGPNVPTSVGGAL